ncbi:MAG: hypothetical protein HY282_14835 [Nitrospirae bacterium]|nr:hypothetical protein [Candidatus Manganitrophaceae bacterium]
MSIGWSIVSILFIVTVLFLFVPFFFTVDSEEKRFSVRWLFINIGFNFTRQRLTIRVVGIPIGRGKKGTKAPTPPSGEATEKGDERAREENEKRPEKGEAPERPSVVKVLFSHRALMVHLTELATRYLIDLLRAFSVSHLDFDLSLDDPMINGICYGALQGVQIKRVYLAVNFWGENRFVGRFALPLYRLAVPTLRVLIHLPYSEMYQVYKEVRHPGPVRKEEVSA